MNESQFFSPSRFARLARQQWQEQRRAWGMFALVLAVLLALLAAILLSDGKGQGVQTGAQVVVYILGMYLAGYLFAHQVFGAWRSREAALVYLMRPASTFEKWLLSALTLLVLFPLMYTAVFVLVYAAAGEVGYHIALAHAQTRGGDARIVDPAAFATFVPLRPHPAVLKAMALHWQAAWGLVFAGLMAYTATGLVYFRRHAALRTLVLAIGLFIATALLLAGMGGNVNEQVLGAWLLPADEQRGLPLGAFVLSWVLWAGVPLLLWAASYRALREKDLS